MQWRVPVPTHCTLLTVLSTTTIDAPEGRKTVGPAPRAALQIEGFAATFASDDLPQKDLSPLQRPEHNGEFLQIVRSTKSPARVYATYCK